MSAQWLSPEFIARARDWVATAADEHEWGTVLDWDQVHVRSWSTAVRVGTTRGVLWFKANGPGTGHEPALLRLLDDAVPGLSPRVVAVDLERCWSLAVDAGPVLRELLDVAQQWPVWEGLVGRYAETQVALGTAAERIRAAGVRDASAAAIPSLARRLLDELAALPVEEGGLDAERCASMQARLTDLEEWCAELAAAAVPDTLCHEDLHSANVCGNGDATSARIIDWGDASWGHPFVSLLTVEDSLVYASGGGPASPELLRVRDAYLEPFTSYDDRAGLLRAAELVRRTGCVAKALSWQAALVDAPPELCRELEFPVRAWFTELDGDVSPT